MGIPRRYPLVALSAVAIAVTLALSGCGEDAAIGDAGLDGGFDARVEGVDPPTPPAAPMPPALPVMTPCRPGWIEVDGPEGTRVCEPYGGPTPDSCPGSEAPFVGEGCAPVGDACPTGDFRDDLPATDVLYVLAGASVGGDGSRGSPLARIADAIARATPVTTIALSKGRFREEIYLRDGEELRIEGACAAETLLTPSMLSLGFGTIEVSDGSLSLANVTLAGARPGIRVEGAAASAVLRSVIVEDTRVVAIGVYSGGRLDAERLVVRRTAMHPDGDAGRAFSLEGGGAVHIVKGVIEDSFDTGIAALSAADTIRLEDVLVRRTALAGEFGDNITVAYGAHIEADGLVVEQGARLGMLALFDGTEVTLRDSVFRSNGEDALQLNLGASATLTRVRFADDLGASIVAGETATLVAEDLVFEREGGRAVSVQQGSTARVARAVAVETGGTAFIVASDMAVPSTLTAEDLTVRAPGGTVFQVQEGGRATIARLRGSESFGTLAVVRGADVRLDATDIELFDPRRMAAATPVEERARGLEVRLGAHANVERMVVTHAFQNGIFVEDASATLSDVVVREGRGRDDIEPELGRGLEAHGSTISVERFVSTGNIGVGFFVGRGTTATVTDATIEDTRGGGLYDVTGKGIVANGGATLTLERVVVALSREAGIAAFEPTTSITARNLVVVRTLGRDCVPAACGTTRLGLGVGAYLSSRVDLTRFAILESALVGIQISDDGAMDARDGLVSGNVIGINVQVPGFDYERLTSNVRLVDNERNVDAEELPIPGAVTPVMDP